MLDLLLAGLLLSLALLGLRLLLSLTLLSLLLLLHLALLLRRVLLGHALLGLLTLLVRLLRALLARTLLRALLLDPLLLARLLRTPFRRSLLLLRGTLLVLALFDLLALGLALLPHLLATLLGHLLLLHPLAFGDLLLALRLLLLALGPLPSLIQRRGLLPSALGLEHALLPGAFAERRLLLQRLPLIQRGALPGELALGLYFCPLHLALLLGDLACPLPRNVLLDPSGIALGDDGLALLILDLSCLLPVETAIVIAAAALLHDLGASVRRIELRRTALPALALPRGEALGRAFAQHAFRLKPRTFPGLGPLAIGAPVRDALARRLPVGARGRDHGPSLGPLRRRHAALRAMGGGPAQRLRARIIARCRLGLPRGFRRRDIAAVAAIDGGDPAFTIAVAVIGIAHEVGHVRAGLVIIIAISVVDRLGIGQIIVACLPDPRLDIVIFEIIIGRGVADRVADPVGPVDPGIAIVIGRVGIAEPLDGRQAGDRRRIAHRRRGAIGQRLDVGKRRQRADALADILVVERRLPTLLSASGEREGERGCAHGP